MSVDVDGVDLDQLGLSRDRLAFVAQVLVEDEVVDPATSGPSMPLKRLAGSNFG